MTERDMDLIQESLSRDVDVVICGDESYMEKLVGFLTDLPESFPDLENYNLALLYVYDRHKQRPEDELSAGICWTHQNKERGLTAYSIGISTYALDRGRDYVLSVFAHESAHVLTGNTGHNELFGIVLDGLLYRLWDAGIGAERLSYPEDRPESP